MKIPHRARPALVVALMVAVLAGALVEIGVRTLVAIHTPDGLRFDPDLVFTFEAHAEVYGVALNDVGAVGDDLLDAAPAATRVFLFGGSTSFAPAYVDRVRSVVGSALGSPCSVISFGRPRYTSWQAMRIAEEVLPAYSPDVAVLYLGINDTIYDTFWWMDGRPDVGYLDWKQPWPPLAVDFVGYHVVAKRLRSRPEFPPGSLRSERLLRTHVEAIAEVAEAHNVRLVLSEFAIALPSGDAELVATIRAQEPVMRHFWGTVESTVRAVEAHNRVLRAVARERGYIWAPVASQMPRDARFFNDICHLTGGAATRCSGGSSATPWCGRWRRLDHRPNVSSRRRRVPNPPWDKAMTEHFRRLEAMYRAAPINGFFRPRLEVSDGSAAITMEVREDFFHAAGALHGSAYFKNLDDAAFFAAASLVEDRFLVTASFTTYLLRPVTSGVLLAEGRVVSSSRNLIVAESVLTLVGGKEVARGSGTFMRSSVKMTDVAAYR
jgi:uncharacterized protein (TIGR00369 family)